MGLGCIPCEQSIESYPVQLALPEKSALYEKSLSVYEKSVCTLSARCGLCSYTVEVGNNLIGYSTVVFILQFSLGLTIFSVLT